MRFGVFCPPGGLVDKPVKPEKCPVRLLLHPAASVPTIPSGPTSEAQAHNIPHRPRMASNVAPPDFGVHSHVLFAAPVLT